MKTAVREKSSVGAPGFFCFIMILRALSALLITNTHLENIYPDNAQFLAVGGLLGDSLFFAISGFCLANLKGASFFKWYGKRILRIYPSVILITLIFDIIFKARYDSWIQVVNSFIYPTNYHFIASIMLLYIPFYFVMKIRFLSDNLPKVMGLLGIVWLLLYIFLFDKSVRLDNAQQPLTKFLFFESMLFGAYMSLNGIRFFKGKNPVKFLVCGLLCLVYFAVKLVIDKYALKNFQCLIILALFIAVCAVMWAFYSAENRLKNLSLLNSISAFVAPLTLEIYVVQRRIISAVAKVEALVFPLNFLAVIALILLGAYVLNRVVYFITLLIKKILRHKM